MQCHGIFGPSRLEHGCRLQDRPHADTHCRIWKVEGDPLARALRQRFRRSGIFPKRKFSCAYSPQQVPNVRLAESEVTVNGAKRPNGTVVFATAAFGLALAGVIVNAVASATV